MRESQIETTFWSHISVQSQLHIFQEGLSKLICIRLNSRVHPALGNGVFKYGYLSQWR